MSWIYVVRKREMSIKDDFKFFGLKLEGWHCYYLRLDQNWDGGGSKIRNLVLKMLNLNAY